MQFSRASLAAPRSLRDPRWGPTIGTKEHLPSRNTFLLLISTREEEKELSIRAENKAEYYHLYYPLFE